MPFKNYSLNSYIIQYRIHIAHKYDVLQAHNDAAAGNYENAKRESWTVWAVVSLAVLIDLLILIIVLVIKTT